VREPVCGLCGHAVRLEASRWTHIEADRDSGHLPLVYEAAEPVRDASAGVADPALRFRRPRRLI
jgi:hypothetical protein